jgi:hypothetical protein
MKISLSVHTIRVKHKEGVKKYKDTILSEFNDRDDFQDVLQSFLQGLSRRIKNDVHQTYLKAENIGLIDRGIEGILESGYYGISSSIRDVETDEIRYKKNAHDADIIPFYFLIHIPKNKNEGIVILQRAGKYGIITDFGRALNNYVLEKYPGYSVEFNTIMEEKLIRKILCNGTIKKIRCIKYNAHTDAIDGLDDGHKESPFNIEIVVSGKNVPLTDKIKNFFDSPNNSNNNIKTLVELHDFKDFDYDTVKVDVEVNDNIKTFDLSALYKAHTYYDISSKVTLGSNGHPLFESVQTIAREHLNATIDQLYPNLATKS